MGIRTAELEEMKRKKDTDIRSRNGHKNRGIRRSCKKIEIKK